MGAPEGRAGPGQLKLAEIEASIALLGVGLDPGIGWGHATLRGRPAAALDLMETARGVVEEQVLRLAGEASFRKVDFSEAPDGQVRLRAPLTHQLAEAVMPRCAERLAPVAEALARRVGAHGGVEATTPLTNRREGCPGPRRGFAPWRA
ncbi:MAG: CRISPR-associated endonuclease Cas1 [Acidimicrobiales bacterium]